MPPIGQDPWLLSEQRWTTRVGEGWVPKRVLGYGGYAIVGLWSYEGPDRQRATPKDIVVKQALANPGLEIEAQFLQRFKDCRSEHIVKIYRGLSQEAGQGTEDYDPSNGAVHRIYLEYCPGGDLFDADKRRFTELDLWRIFHCLARGILVMHQGNEDPEGSRWDIPQICHFDIKPENIFIGKPIMKDDHDSTSPYKEQLHFPIQQLNMPEADLRDYVRPWQPEVDRPSRIINPRYGTASNIWQAGLIMLCLIREMRDVQWDALQCYQSSASIRLITGGLTVGTDEDQMEDEYGTSRYGNNLRILIAECLLISPESRPSPKYVFYRTKFGITAHRPAEPPSSPMREPSRR
ncbi:uncharacterized protein BP5553_04884 [Venustampulla echinocandica]|uniref:Protein kinase domain-containing protein n=1 Tax=Venustampulla echinocandica TaxID=2656787 RepID=A0A370TPJ5_9HELO|nr:uncharacterized protein BP5553_04884 [Venustampulla echinocandica]RDL37451.1 hypothetical protein BP5553_04884 [Venustampulla echinocandica]